ncbi:hypothetical protein [Bradyrhizobium sp. MOS002]|nr:hypothetical protein [Bradyrhizobium sp. MOS002]
MKYRNRVLVRRVSMGTRDQEPEILLPGENSQGKEVSSQPNG